MPATDWMPEAMAMAPNSPRVLHLPLAGSRSRLPRRPRRRQPGRWRQAALGLLLTGAGSGLLVGLMQLPERLDTLLLISHAIANLISGLSRFAMGVLQLIGVLAMVLAVLAALLLLAAGVVRVLRALLPRPRQARSQP